MTKTVAIIVSGGSGTRFNKDLPKQYTKIKEKMVIEYTMDAFQNHPEIQSIYLVLPSEDRPEGLDGELHEKYSKLNRILDGGKTRSESVAIGVKALSDDEEPYDVVLIHDGVRLLVSERLISDVIAKTNETGACIAAISVSDTLKQVSDNGIIEKTISRDRLWQAQTPQGFNKEIITKAYEAWINNPVGVSDDSALVEGLGIDVSVVVSDRTNIKLTYPEDLVLVEKILEERNK